MTDQQDPRHEQYDRVRDAFDDLKIEDKTAFLIKETVNTIVQGVEEAARTIIGEFDSMFGGEPAEEAAEAADEQKTAAENGAAKKSTARKKSTASKGQTATAKKTTAKKTTTRKTTTRKTTAKKTTGRKTTPKKDDSDAS